MRPPSISGRVKDDLGGSLPGVTVTLSSGDQTRTALTQSDGGFEFADLRPGVYRFGALLVPFVLRKTEPVVVVPGTNACIILTLDLAPNAIREDRDGPFVLAGPPRLDLTRFDAVVRLKVTATANDLVCGYASHTAEVLEVLKASAPIAERITFLQDRINDSARPCKVGDEYVLFLRRDTKGLVMNPEMTGGFLIHGGTVQPLYKEGWDRYDGMTVSELLAELRQSATAR